MEMEDKEQVESFITVDNRKGLGGFSAAKVYYALWGGLFLFLLILVILVGYQISLTKNLSKQGTTDPSQYSSLRQGIVSAMDFSADPCTDFYQYSCGSLISSLQLPPGSSVALPTIQNITRKNYEIMYDICNDQWPLISDLYQSCMAPVELRTEDSNTALIGLITDMQQSLTDSTPAVLLPLLASLHRMGVDAFFVPDQFENIFVPNPKVDLYIEATGNTAGIDYTDQTDLDYLANTIAAWLGALFPTYTKDNATNAVNVEKALDILANSDNITDLPQALAWSNFTSLTALDYSLYTSAINLQMQPSDTLLLFTSTFFEGLTSILTGTSRQAVSDYLSWRIAYSLAFAYPLFGSDFTASLKIAQPKPLRKIHSFVDLEPLRAELGAYEDLTERELDCVDTVDYLLGDFLGLIFTMKVLDDEVVENIRTVTGGVQNAFLNTLPKLTWIDEYSKEQAAYKIKNIVQLIGHPNKLDRYRGLVLDSAHFLSNIVAINARVFDDDMSKIGTVFDRTSNEFSATVVNAFYSPYTNTINFPAGILESPFFSTSFPKILQYARMGYVIGHETTHGFDNNGRLWNAFGQYTPIMDNMSSAEFNTRAACLVNQYNKFEPVPNYFVNGERTLGENIADLGGVKNAYKAYKAWAAANGTENLQLTSKSPFVPALTNDQLFFVMMAQTWCTKSTDQYLIRQLKVDVHSPSKYRVNGPLANFDSFSDAFSCPVGSPMNPSDKCNLW